MAGKAEFQEYGRGCLYRLNQGQAHHNTQKRRTPAFPIHIFEWGFVRLAPFALMEALVGVFLPQKRYEIGKGPRRKGGGLFHPYFAQ